MNKKFQPNHLKILFGIVTAILLLVLVGCGAPNIKKLKDQGNYSRIIEILLDTDQEPSVRIEAANALADSDDKETVDALLKTFTISDIGPTGIESLAARKTYTSKLRRASLDSLIKIGNSDVINELIEVAYKKPWGEERLVIMAMEALVEIGMPTIEVIKERRMVNINREIEAANRLSVVLSEVVTEIGGLDAFDFLLNAWISSCPFTYKDPAGDCRFYYDEYILPLVGVDKVDSETLISYLSGDDPELRQAAVYSLRYFDSTEKSDALLEACRDENILMRYLAARSLIYENHQEGVETLVDLIQEYGQDKSEYLVEVIKDMHVQSTEIDDVKYSQIVDFLIGLFDFSGSDSVADNAQRALELIADERAETVLLDELNHSNPTMRRFAALTLGALEGEKVISSLVEALNDEDSHVVDAAFDSLKKIGDSEALFPYLNRDNQQVTDAVFDNIYRVLMKIDLAGNSENLIDALWKFGGPEMAETFYNSGYTSLKTAADEWADKHGYYFSVMPLPSVP